MAKARVIVAIALTIAVGFGASSAHGGAPVVDPPRTGGVIVGDTPVAIAVRGPETTIATWERRDARSGPRWSCGYYGLENGSTSGISIGIDYGSGPVQPVAEGIYAFVCVDGGGRVAHNWFGRYDPADPFAGVLAAERAAELAIEQLDLAAPAIHLNPPGDQLVGLPSWLWLDTPWAPAEATASVSGVAATVRATPISVRWEAGDGTVVDCNGPGVAYDETREVEPPAACVLVFTRSSIDEPPGMFELRATITYAVDWSSTGGGSGVLGTVERTASIAVRVVEAQAVIGRDQP
jgi:hypothetical protein